MSSKDLEFPRMVYRGPADDSAETNTVTDQDSLDVAVKEGWRLKRVDKKHPPEPELETLKVPAQTLTATKDKK